MIIAQEISSDSWPTLAGSFGDFGYEQSVTYSQASAKRIGASLRFFRIDDTKGNLISAATIRVKTVPGLGRGIAWIASGPLVFPDGYISSDVARLPEILGALHTKLVEQEGHVLRLRLSGTAFQDEGQVCSAMKDAGFRPTDRASAYRSVIIDLGLDEETRMKALHGKWRGHLRKSLKANLNVEQGKDQVFRDRFMTLFNEVQAAKGFRPDIGPAFHFALAGPDYEWTILIASKDSQDLAGIVVGFSGQTAVYLFGATGALGRRLQAGYFLTWQGLAMAQGRGAKWYDMGGLDEELNPAVAEFKLRMNGRPVLAHPYEARPAGLRGAMIGRLEALHASLKGRA